MSRSLVSIAFIVTSLRIHPAYRMGFLKRYWLGVRMFVNTIRIRTGTSYKTHLVMAMKVLIGAGTGLALGEYYFGPWADRAAYPLQHSNAGSYTRKDLSGHWTYYPEEG